MGELNRLAGDDFETYVALPAGELRGGLVVIHEIWGLADHIKDVADRVAAEGYLAMAPDVLSQTGVTPLVGAELLRLRTSASPQERARRKSGVPQHQPS